LGIIGLANGFGGEAKRLPIFGKYDIYNEISAESFLHINRMTEIPSLFPASGMDVRYAYPLRLARETAWRFLSNRMKSIN
jgi:hypothetical protein